MVHADLPHKVVERDYGPRNIQWSVENIREIVAEGVRCEWVDHRRALLVAHRFTWLQLWCKHSIRRK